MADITIFIGNKAYSSWSLRGWLALDHVGLPYDEVVIPLADAGKRTTAIEAHSPTGKVPALKHGELLLWDSLAINEYLAETFPAAKLWPDDKAARAVARCVGAEMHSSFTALREQMPMNVRRTPFVLPPTPQTSADVARIQAIWKECRSRFGAAGPFLFGRFSVADAMYAPVATRFRTYGVTLDATAKAYVEAIYGHPSMTKWVDAANKETWFLEKYESIGK